MSARRWYRIGNWSHFVMLWGLVALRLHGELTWPWWRVTMPLWGSFAVLFVVMWRLEP